MHLPPEPLPPPDPPCGGLPEILTKERKGLRGSEGPAGAFTLIEALVVVGIIAVLAALLFPVFQKAQQTALAAKCAANLKQIGIAATSFAGDNNGLIVPQRTQVGSSAYYWCGLLAPYLGAASPFAGFHGSQNATPYMCPVAMTNSTGSNYYSQPIGNYGPGGAPLEYRLRYAINLHITAYTTADLSASQTYRAGRMSQMKASETCLFADVFGSGSMAYWTVTSGLMTFPHSGNVNVLYLDGHVQQQSKAQMQYYASLPYHVFWRGYNWGYPGYTEN